MSDVYTYVSWLDSTLKGVRFQLADSSVNGFVRFLCFTVFVNCLLKTFAMMFGVDSFLLNVMVLLVVGAGCLFKSPCSVFHHMSVLCL